MKIERLTNTQSINSYFKTVELRMATFESQAVNLVKSDSAFESQQYLQKCCREICKHIRRHCSIMISSANFYFKIDKHNRPNYAFNFRRWDRLLQLKKLWYSKLYPKTQKFNNRTQLDKIIKNQRIYLRRIVLNLSTTSNQVRKTIKKVGLMFLAILKMARKSLNQKTTLNLKTTLQSYCQITIVQYRCK